MKQRKETYAVRNYKDMIFRMLFSDKKNLLSLYNALNGTCYQDPEDVKITTLENVVYIRIKNDLSFVIALQLNIYEHQSKYSPNMPLRNLGYVTTLYEPYVTEQDIYGSKVVKLPEPKFIVFYNGTEEKPDCQELRLSDAFERQSGDPQLELKVTMININYGKNQALMEACPILGEYVKYVHTVREYERTMSLNDAVSNAISDCIRDDILKTFLLRNGAEVKRMSVYDYNEELHLKFFREEAIEEGLEEGRKEGHKEGCQEGLAKGRALSFILLVRKQIEKGMDECFIADIFGEDIFNVKYIMNLIKENEGQSDEEIYHKWGEEREMLV